MQTPVVKFKLPKSEKTEAKNAQPIADVLYMMSKGDSAIVHQKIDSAMKKSINLPHVDVLDFHVALIDIKNEEDHQKEASAEKQIMEEKAKELTGQSEEVAAKAKKILEDYKANKLKNTIVTTPSGLKYLILEAGNGPKAQAGKTVNVNYYGMLMDGSRFDDSWSRGQEFSFPLGQGRVIKGWDEGIANLNEGSKACLFIPANLAYGAEGSPPVIPANAELVFYIELNKIN
jgi:FKBP-type peptidyl-prolyl cis-trans isomerase